MARRHIQLNFKIIIPTALLVLGIITLVVAWPAIIESIRQNAQTNTPQPGDPVGDTVVLTPAQQRYQEAVEIASTEGEEQAQELLNEALNEATTNEERAEVYQQKASIATLDPENPKLDDALQYAYLAEEQAPTYGTAIVIAELEDYDYNNYEAAIQYYQLYIDRLTDEAVELNPGDREFYQNRITELEALL
jgi:tetratricopeptide (TPR) repeat protein